MLVHDWTGIGVGVNAFGDATVRNSIFYDGIYGVVADSTSTVTVENVTAYNNSSLGVNSRVNATMSIKNTISVGSPTRS